MKKSCTSISNVIAWLEKQRDQYGEVDVRLTSEWMEINMLGYVDPNDDENPQWVKDNIGSIKKPFVVLSPSNCEFSEDRQTVIRYNRNLSPFVMMSFIDDIEEKLDKIKSKETTVEETKEYLDKIKARFSQR